MFIHSIEVHFMLTDPYPGRNGHDEGLALRDAGCARARKNHPEKTVQTKLALLQVLYDLGPTTIDAIDPPTELSRKFREKAGNYRGAAVSALRMAGLIAPSGRQRRSERASRHGGRNPEWELVDRGRAGAEIQRLRRQLALPLRADIPIPSDLMPRRPG
jgi:hypothetical protein